MKINIGRGRNFSSCAIVTRGETIFIRERQGVNLPRSYETTLDC